MIPSPYKGLVEDNVIRLDPGDGGPVIEVSPKGFCYGGEFIEDTDEIYLKFKKWVDLVFEREFGKK